MKICSWSHPPKCISEHVLGVSEGRGDFLLPPASSEGVGKGGGGKKGGGEKGERSGVKRRKTRGARKERMMFLFHRMVSIIIFPTQSELRRAVGTYGGGGKGDRGKKKTAARASNQAMTRTLTSCPSQTSMGLERTDHQGK